MTIEEALHALDVLAGELARLRGMRCETCRDWTPPAWNPECGGRCKGYVLQQTLPTFCCGAWEAK
jgi:hypothetical protein